MKTRRGMSNALGVVVFLLASVVSAAGQQIPSLFGRPEPQPQEAPALPPAGSPTLLRSVQLQFPTQGDVGSVDYDTYLYYMRVTDHISMPSSGRWVPYTEEIERIAIEDHARLWNTGFLSDLWIEEVDDPYPNGVPAKRLVYNLEERERVKIVTYEGSDELKTEDINLNLEENGIAMRLDSFIDPGTIRRVKWVIRGLFAAKGYMFAEVDHSIESLPGGPKLVRVTFHMDEGPKVQVEEIDFRGNTAFNDGTLKGKMKNVKERWWLSWMTGRGTYKPEQYEEDAEALEAFYRNEGFITAQIGQPDIEYLEESEDGETRGMRLRIPVDEGERYRIGALNFAGNEILLEEGLRQIFDDIEPGEFYSESKVREGFDDARELYGSLGYYEMTLAPDLRPRTEDEVIYVDDGVAIDVAPGESNGNGNGNGEPANGNGNGEPAATNGNGNGEPAANGNGEAAEARRVAEVRPARIDGSPVVDVTIRVQEGEQFFINRIEFTGNEVTHDEVIRRELQIAENAVFNTEALKHSVRRLNQLGFFEPIEEATVGVERNQATDNEVDVTFDLTEANLNQLTFGAGVSQFDGFFGQVSFQTSNFLGRGETLGVSLMNGARARNYTLSFTRPFNFGRPLSLGTQIYSRKIDWIGSFTDETTGGSVTTGWPLSFFTRMFVSYSIDQSEVSDFDPQLGTNPQLLAFNPFLADILLLETGGRRTVSKITPQVRHNTVDHPIFPTQGRNLSASVELAGLGGDTRFVKPTLEAVWFTPHTSRTIFGVRAQSQFLVAGRPETIPLFERLWLGGEYSVRGFDIRRIGPTFAATRDDVTEETFTGRTVIGGNKSLLFNVEYQFILGGPVRLITFYDAGQVQNFGRDFAMNDFKTSTGLELRFFMPMLNVPFRLIYYWNPQREGVYNDRLYEQEDRGFRFAMGSTF